MGTGGQTPFAPGDLHVDRALTNFLVAYPPNGMVGHDIFPIIPVTKESDLYWEMYASGRIIKDTRRAPDGYSTRAEIGYKQSTFTCFEYAAHDNVPHRMMDNADDPLTPAEDAAANARDVVFLDVERDITTIAEAATNTTAATEAWDGTLANVVFASDILAAKEAVRQRLGVPANTIAISAAAASAAAIWLLEQKNGAGVEFSSIESYLAQGTLPPYVFGLRVIQSGAVKTSEVRPDQITGSTMSDVFGKDALVFYQNPRPGLRRISFGYTLRLTGSLLARRGTYEGPIRSDWVESSVTECHKLVSQDCCQRITGVLS